MRTRVPRLLLLPALLAPALAAGCANRASVDLRANEQVTYIASVDGSAALRNTGDTPVTVVKESVEREPVRIEDLQPRDRLDHELAAGERITVISSFNLPATFRLGFTGAIDESFVVEGPSPAPAPRVSPRFQAR
ncbi:MAG: hypothetical protein IBJ10_05330 [Phycisphaerales bacterium]|nr:hypothetical protein [Phycisphaerales bacterium]